MVGGSLEERMARFSIRDLLFLLAIIALALGWWFDRRPIPARFQMHVTTNRAYVLDTATGQVWSRGVRPDGELTGSADIHSIKLAK